MKKITSGMLLPEKLRAHADNITAREPSERIARHLLDASWCMRDAANVIVGLNNQINRLEDVYNEYFGDRPDDVGKGKE